MIPQNVARIVEKCRFSGRNNIGSIRRLDKQFLRIFEISVFSWIIQATSKIRKKCLSSLLMEPMLFLPLNRHFSTILATFLGLMSAQTKNSNFYIGKKSRNS